MEYMQPLLKANAILIVEPGNFYVRMEFDSKGATFFR